MNQLIDYLKQVKEDLRAPSNRAFARYLGISPRTLGRIWAGEEVGRRVLNAIADNLNLSPVEVYRLAGVLPDENELKSLIAKEIEYLLAKLPPEDQEEIRQIAKMKAERRRKEMAQKQAGADDD